MSDYKEGDKVKVKSLEWYNENKNIDGDVLCFGKKYKFTSLMSSYCDKVVTISSIDIGDGEYFIEEDGEVDLWTDDMFAGYADETESPKGMKYKEGDIVRVKSLDWYNSTKDSNGWIDLNGFKFNPDMKKFCGKIFTIKDAWLEGYYEFKGNEYCWTDDMIEGLASETVGSIEMALSLKGCLKYNKVTICSETCAEEVEISFDDDYEIIYRDGKMFAVKKIPKYPTTYEECCIVLEYIPHTDDVIGYKWDFLLSLQKLLICRDAYWKIAGEEMGLDKPWEPEYKTLVDNTYFTIHTFNEEIVKSATSHRNAILVFPTEEMQDAFYENFKEQIEQCKELL